MRQVILNSNAHYQMRETSDGIELVEFPEDCPDMGDRDNFQESEGVVIATFEKDEPVEFCFSSSFTKCSQSLCTEQPICGDDFL